MVSVKAILRGEFKNVAGVEEVQVEVNNPTVRGVIDRLAAKYGSKFLSAALDGAELKLDVTVMVNDADFQYLSGLDTPVNQGDIVTFITGVVGAA